MERLLIGGNFNNTTCRRTSMADSDDEESYITIGNPLPEIEEDEALPKPVKYQEQSVKDARGRPQRFHGAFTGGFSAGYFNTVATPEGFEPSTFVSSRIKRADNVQQQHPEDFMDPEDLGEHGIAPRKIETTTKFESQESATKRQLRKFPKEGLLSSHVLASLITPASLPMGVKLLRKMGWKEGQGIGPRQMKRKKKKPGHIGSSNQKVYGCALPTSTSDGESEGESDEDNQGIAFAPKDVTPISFKPKDNMHGIGYSGINPHSAFGQGQGHFSLFDQPDVPSLKGKKKGMRGQAFGVGAMNDDDEDIFATDNLSRYNFEINDDEPQDNNYGWTAPRKHSGGKQSGSSKVIEGFKLSKQTRFSKKTYPAPQLPKGFKPFHQLKTKPEIASTPENKGKERHDASSRSEVLGEAPEFRSVFDLVPEAGKKRIDAMKPNIPQRTNRWDRKESLPSASSKDQKAETTDDKPQASTSEGREKSTGHKEDEKTRKESDGGINQEQRKQNVPLFQPATYSAVGGFKPFEKVPEKQQRYEAFLEAKKKGVPYVPDAKAAVTEWEKGNEKEEFFRAAQLYTRVNSVMAARFTHGQHGDAIDSIATTTKTEEMEVDRSDQDKAAEMKMFGKLTREVVEWHPHKNLCKYFNIPNPYPDSTIVGLKTVKRDKYSLYNFLHVPEEPELPSPPPKEAQKALPAPPDKSKPEKKKSIFTEETLAKVNQKISFKIGVDQQSKKSEEESSSGQAESKNDNGEELMAKENDKQEEEEEEVQEEERPPMDLFRAIFSGSESSSDSESEDEEASKSTQEQLKKPVEQPVIASQINDASALNNTAVTSTSIAQIVDSVEAPSVNNEKDSAISTHSEVMAKDSDSRALLSSDTEIKLDQGRNDTSYGPSLPPDLYGPAPPPTISATAVTSRDDHTSTSGSRSRSGRSKHKSDRKKSSHKERKKSKHKKEKKKKSKHKRSSSKHKEKKKNRETTTSSDESHDSDDSGKEEVDEKELITRLKKFAR